MRHGRFVLALLLLPLFAWAEWSAAQPPKRPAPPPKAEEPDDEPSAEEARDKAVAERFRKVLETNPRRGTALDKLYGYHVERGTLDQLIGEYAGRRTASMAACDANSTDGGRKAAWNARQCSTSACRFQSSWRASGAAMPSMCSASTR